MNVRIDSMAWHEKDDKYAVHIRATHLVITTKSYHDS